MTIRTSNAPRSRLIALITVVTLCAGFAAPTFAGPKEDLHAEMAALHAQMQTLKPLINSDQQAATSYATAESRCAQISAQMGGDLPVAEGGQASAGGGAIRGTVPTVPTNCVPTTVTATQSAAVPIADVTVSTSTVAVTGAGTWLWDINVTTNITHTFAADMDITLTSPAGTVVTLTTDNGAGNDNVFNGTVWDDDANPAGAVPYTTNNGLATDHAYVNLTTATPLVAEEALAAFQGENPNGTWTLSVSDDLTGDTGSIDSWSVEVTTFPAAPLTATTNATQSTPTPIADVAVSTSTLAVAGAGTSICKVVLTTNITHTFSADMDITLTSPAGTVVTLTTDNGAGNDNTFAGTVWDDDANPAGAVPYVTNNGVATDHAYVNLTTATPLVVEESMGAFMGENPNGTWSLSVSDDLTGDTGTINSWSLDFTTCTCQPPDANLSITKTVSAAPTTIVVGSPISFLLTINNAGPANATAVVVTDVLPAILTHNSNNCGATLAGNTLTWNIGALANGANATCTVNTTVNSGGTIANTATVVGAEPDPVTGNNTSAVTVGQAAAQAVSVNAPWMLALLGMLIAALAFVGLRRVSA
jgi:uncharacterized repeat protein (TIGR01451 family)